jgi:trimeric autotransporter adhesin
VAVDAAGNLYISDSENFRIRKVSRQDGIITTVAGNGAYGFSGDGGAAVGAMMANPLGLSIDASGNLYIADSFNDRIRKVSAVDGMITTVAGGASSGFSGDGGPATAARLRYPFDVAVDSSGNLLISDSDNNRIRKVAVTTGIISTVAGSSSLDGGDGGPATEAGFDQPYGLALDAAGNIYIADSGNGLIRRVDAASGIISTVAGDGSESPRGDGGPATAAGLSAPFDVAFDASGNLFIVDYGHDRIREVSAENGIISTVAGHGDGRDFPEFSGDDGPATLAGIDHPHAVALDRSGNLYVADESNNRIRKWFAATGLITTVAGDGDGGSAGDGGPATAASISEPVGVALDVAGNLYIAEVTRIRKVSAESGIISTLAGNGNFGSSGDNGPATTASVYPSGLAVDPSGNVYIAGDSRIRRVAAANGVITTVAGNDTAGFSGDGGPATLASLRYPAGVSVDATGSLFIADTGNDRIRKVSAESGIISTIAGNGARGFSGDGSSATAARLYSPNAITFDAAGSLYFADSGNHRIRRISPDGTISTVAGDGTQGLTGDEGKATQAGLAFPTGLVLNAVGDLFIADSNSDRVRAVYACVPVAGTQLITPSDGAFGVSPSTRLAWSAVRSAFRYDLFLDKVNPPLKLVSEDVNATSYAASNLESGTTYYWEIVAKGDPFCPSPSTASSEVRSFTTAAGCGPASFD